MILIEVTRTSDIVELHTCESQKLKATMHSGGEGGGGGGSWIVSVWEHSNLSSDMAIIVKTGSYV